MIKFVPQTAQTAPTATLSLRSFCTTSNIADILLLYQIQYVQYVIDSLVVIALTVPYRTETVDFLQCRGANGAADGDAASVSMFTTSAKYIHA